MSTKRSVSVLNFELRPPYLSPNIGGQNVPLAPELFLKKKKLVSKHARKYGGRFMVNRRLQIRVAYN